MTAISFRRAVHNGWQGPANHFCTAKTRTIGERCGILDMNSKRGSRTDDVTRFKASVSIIGGRGSLPGRTNTILGDPEADRGAGRKLGTAVSLFVFSPSPSPLRRHFPLAPVFLPGPRSASGFARMDQH